MNDDKAITKAKMLLSERGEVWTNERIDNALPFVTQYLRNGAGTVENAVNMTARMFEQRFGQDRHGSVARRRGF